jgi:hypothetical protein
VPNHNQQSDTADNVDPDTVERAVELCEALLRRVGGEMIPAMLPSLAPSEAE